MVPIFKVSHESSFADTLGKFTDVNDFFADASKNFRLLAVRRVRDTSRWKGQLENPTSWKVLSWKVRYEIGKNEVGKFAQE